MTYSATAGRLAGLAMFTSLTSPCLSLVHVTKKIKTVKNSYDGNSNMKRKKRRINNILVMHVQ